MNKLTVDVAAIGTGAAGMAACRAAKAQGARTVMIEGGQYGTTCARVRGSRAMVGLEDARYRAAALQCAERVRCRPGPLCRRTGDLKRGESRKYELVGWVSADTLRDRKTRKMGDGFQAALSGVANRALARYPHPGGIPADALVEVKFMFGMEGQMAR